MIRQHLRNNVVGYLALVIAMGGTSYAAVQLQAGQVKTKHLANQAVTSKKVKDGTIKARDVKGKVLGTSRVLARPRFTGNVGVVNDITEVPMSAAGWTQAANEMTTFVGQFTLDTPSSAQCGGADKEVTLEVMVGSRPVLSRTISTVSWVGVGTRVYHLDLSWVLFEPGAPTPQTVEARFWDTCTSLHPRVRSILVDAIGVR
ncbi:MAG TPA: hypothetical protein VLI04_15100 [Nocardioidaceae bacterium]|nr:hypothetical protein [Nocardioidaceae bacterium]